jgi:hypothetical protein
MTRDQFITWAESQGWKKDRFGHLQKTRGAGEQYRFKLSRITVRYEVKSTSGWVRLRSGYFSKLSIEDGQLKGLQR